MSLIRSVQDLEHLSDRFLRIRPFGRCSEVQIQSLRPSEPNEVPVISEPSAVDGAQMLNHDVAGMPKHVGILSRSTSSGVVSLQERDLIGATGMPHKTPSVNSDHVRARNRSALLSTASRSVCPPRPPMAAEVLWCSEHSN